MAALRTADGLAVVAGSRAGAAVADTALARVNRSSCGASAGAAARASLGRELAVGTGDLMKAGNRSGSGGTGSVSRCRVAISKDRSWGMGMVGTLEAPMRMTGVIFTAFSSEQTSVAANSMAVGQQQVATVAKGRRGAWVGLANSRDEVAATGMGSGGTCAWGKGVVRLSSGGRDGAAGTNLGGIGSSSRHGAWLGNEPVRNSKGGRDKARKQPSRGTEDSNWATGNSWDSHCSARDFGKAQDGSLKGQMTGNVGGIDMMKGNGTGAAATGDGGSDGAQAGSTNEAEGKGGAWNSGVQAGSINRAEGLGGGISWAAGNGGVAGLGSQQLAKVGKSSGSAGAGGNSIMGVGGSMGTWAKGG